MIIKKIGVIITSLIFITTLSLTSVKADEIVSTDIDTYSPSLTEEENKQINGAKYLVEYLRQGGSIDLTNKSSGYTAVDLIDDIADFFNGTLAQMLGDEGYWINNISESQVPEYIYLKEPIIKSFVTFGINALCDLTTSEELPSVNPPEEYNTILDTINGSGFYFKNYTLVNNTGVSPIQPLDIKHSSWVKTKANSNDTQKYPSPIITFNITLNQNNQYQVVYSGYSISEYTKINDNYRTMYTMNNPNIEQSNIFKAYYSNNYYSSTDFNNVFTGERSSIMSWLTDIAAYFKNVNIYVNGEPWSIVQEQNYHIDMGQGTYIDNTNQPIQYDYPEPTKIDLTDLIDRLDLLIANQNKIKFPDFSDLIVDEDGQQAVAVVVVNKDLTIDDWYVTNYGTLIPLFPVFVDYPISMTDITTIATVGIKDVIPTDILEVLGIALVGMLFVTWIHRLLE